MTEEIRWQQRFQNFDRAFVLLHSALHGKALSTFTQLEQEGLIQRFEYSFELAWKTMKDYLAYSGVTLQETTPRAVIKSAFGVGIIHSGEVFIKMMLTRNLLAHCYDVVTFQEALGIIQASYLPALEELHAFFMERTQS